MPDPSLETRTLAVPSSSGTFDAFLARPTDGTVPWAVLLMDAGGVRNELRALATEIAAKGFAVLVPDLYHRQGAFRPFDMKTVFSVAEERDRLMGMARALQAVEALADVEATLDHVGAARAGVFGYCLGGRLAYLAAARLADRVFAAASFHGGGLVTQAPESPHLLAKDVRAPLYFAVADDDATCTPEHQAALRAALDAAGVAYELELYAGKRHGFAVPGTAAHDEAASARAHEKLLALFAQHAPR